MRTVDGCSARTATRRGTKESTATNSYLLLAALSTHQHRRDGRIDGRSRFAYLRRLLAPLITFFALVQEEHPCPFPDCLETFVKSVHVKRHLTSNHGVANPLQWLEDQVCHLEDLG